LVLGGVLYLVVLYLGDRFARLRRKRRVRVPFEEILVILLRQVRLRKIVLSDFRDGH